jgi:diguanylate cyclase (GGDEF)-like protein
MEDDRIKLQQCRRRTTMLEDRIRSNEHILYGFHSIEIDMVGAHSLGDLIDVLSQGIPKTFHNVECVTLACLDPEYELTRMLEGGQQSDQFNRSFVPLEQSDFDTIYQQPYKPWLGQFQPAQHGILFPHQNSVGSVAIAPLVFRGQLIGSLNQGSQKSTHFTSGAATDLLEHLAAVTAMCVDNTVSHERLKLDGLTDSLTGISNRRFFERRLKEEVGRWRRSATNLCCVVVDIDHFKQVNDRFGHRVGDIVLERVARELGKVLRSSDVLARYGGEEFVLLLPETPVAVACEIAERLRHDVAAMEFDEEVLAGFQVTVSLGLASLTPQGMQGGDSPGDWLFQQADSALYRAKNSGRNRVVVAAHETQVSAG